jgi:hypothetical protein
MRKDHSVNRLKIVIKVESSLRRQSAFAAKLVQRQLEPSLLDVRTKSPLVEEQRHLEPSLRTVTVAKRELFYTLCGYNWSHPVVLPADIIYYIYNILYLLYYYY